MSAGNVVWQLLPNPFKDVARKGRRALLSARIRAASRETSFGFASEVTNHVLGHRKTRIETPITDTARFPNESPRSTHPALTFAVLNFIKSHSSELNQVAHVLADDGSRECLKSVLAYHAFGPTKVALEGVKLFPSKLHAVRHMRKDFALREFLPFPMHVYEVNGDDGRSIEVECWDISAISTFLERQYFFSRNGVEVCPAEGEIVIDAGACFGDTALLFSSVVGRSGEIHSFEPLARQREVFENNLQRNPHLAPRISLHAWALDETSDRQLTFTDGGPGARASGLGTMRVTTVSLDDFVRRQCLRTVDFIKMDIEGAETAALRGAAETIQRFRPKLAISIYHSLDDLVRIPLLVHQLAPDYELYIQHHTIHAEETILYARPRTKRQVDGSIPRRG